jgi:hypothetical protein
VLIVRWGPFACLTKQIIAKQMWNKSNFQIMREKL